MPLQYLPLRETNQFSALFLDFLDRRPELQPFAGYPADLDGFRAQLAEKSFDAAKRQTLVEVLERQYAGVPQPPDLAALRDENTFTVTTGHQLNLFTGPLYVLFKLVSTINLARRLAREFPEYRFVPVYWMATEDHDFEEINHVRLFGRTHTWNTAQTGAVGRMDPRELRALFTEIPEAVPVFERAYLQSPTLAAATRQVVHELLGAEGLICLDADDSALKAEFRDVMQDDAFNQTAFRLVNETSERLVSLGYKSQVTPREINFFYLEDGLRERLVPADAEFAVNGTGRLFSADELRTLIDEHPERLSPNVILRPVYQEVILPNLAYLGGPGEVAYWLQLKPVFEHYAVPFPILMPRNFGMFLTAATRRRIEKLGLSLTDLFLDETALRRAYLRRHTAYPLDLPDEVLALAQTLETVHAKAVHVDPTLGPHVRAQQKRLSSWMARLEKRLLRSEAQNQETTVRQLHELKEHLFPGGGLQERTDNFLTFQAAHPTLIQDLLAAFDPLDFRFILFDIS
jgi:bacillithiol biosynthesis cysteine-adding enzyme BshC